PINGTIQVAPLASDLDVGLVNSPWAADRPGKTAPAFLELRGVALHPAHDRGMRHRQAALGHHLYQVAQTELEPKIPAPAQDDDFAVEVATQNTPATAFSLPIDDLSQLSTPM